MDTATAYATAARPLTAVLQGVPPGAWGAPSPCDDWTARDVVRHLVETQRDLLAGHGVDVGGLPDVDADPARAWQAHADRVHEARAEHIAGRLDAAALKAIEDEAILEVIRQQEAAGLHAVTDGEFRRSFWHFDFFGMLDGVEIVEQREGGQQGTG